MGFEGPVHVLKVGVEVSEGIVDETDPVEAYRTHLGVLDLPDCEQCSFPVALHGRDVSSHPGDPRIGGIELLQLRVERRRADEDDYNEYARFLVKKHPGKKRWLMDSGETIVKRISQKTGKKPSKRRYLSWEWEVEMRNHSF